MQQPITHLVQYFIVWIPVITRQSILMIAVMHAVIQDGFISLPIFAALLK
jgi:hypothetical protein